jgi:hypothetical protein
MIKHPKNRYERLRIKKVKEFGKKETARLEKLEHPEGLYHEPLEIEVPQD